MEKTILGLLILMLGMSFTTVFALPSDFQNKELNANLADGRQIYVQFTDDLYPMIDNGYIVGTSEFSLADTPLRIYQNGFLITMPEEGWFMTGTKTKTGDYSVQLNEWTGKQFLKTVFDASLQDVTLETPVIVPQSHIVEKTFTWKAPESKTDLIVLVHQSFRNYWNDNYQIFVRVFDKSKNPNPQFDDHFGTVDGAQIYVTLSNPTLNTKYEISGISKNNGYWQGNQYFAENISPPGKYLVDVTAQYGGTIKKTSEEMFLFGVSANRVSAGNSTSP
ncbi:MAG: hypothetical protein EPO63_03495 [Candidatus Nitrosotenuis sp.]|nr:MAG: hypothetical protein EPO63_03495 [Candidatus Nitrosotenuis sp.]